MIFENWKNTRELWDAVEEYWKVLNMVIWHTPNRMQGFTAQHKFYNKYDIAILGEEGKGIMNEDPEAELEEYLKERGQKLLDSYEVILYGYQGGKNDLSAMSKHQKMKFGAVRDHISYNVGSESSSGQNLIFGTKPIPILIPYIKVLSQRGGVIMEPFGGSGSTLIASEIMKRKCYAIELSPLYAEVILRRWEKFTGKKAVKGE